jgi:hypothetical protein
MMLGEQGNTLRRSGARSQRFFAFLRGTAFDFTRRQQGLHSGIPYWRKIMPDLWKRAEQPRTLFGDVVILVFLASQALDGVLTYLGVVQFGPSIEANPVVAVLMGLIGHGPALATVKLLAASLGIVLHLGRVHRVLAVLTVFYILGSVVPWTALLFF